MKMMMTCEAVIDFRTNTYLSRYRYLLPRTQRLCKAVGEAVGIGDVLSGGASCKMLYLTGTRSCDRKVSSAAEEEEVTIRLMRQLR